jgi:DNA repair protein RecO (recombination protein O)
MIEKIRGIVLQQIKYTDSGIIVRFFTREAGGMSVMVKGLRRGKSAKRNVFFQPMFILDMEVYNKDSRGLQLLKEYSPSFLACGLRDDVRKSCVAIFLGEVLSSVIRDEGVNPELYDFIERSVLYFDSALEPFANFHISFLSLLCGYLGFAPQRKDEMDDLFFDLADGRFTVLPPPHGGYLDSEISALMSRFFYDSYDEAKEIRLNGKQRDDILDALLKYYSVHTPMMKKINSLEVMKEVFS